MPSGHEKSFVAETLHPLRGAPPTTHWDTDSREMKADTMATQDVSQDMRDERTPSAVDRTGDRGGSIGMVLAVSLLLVGSVIAFLFVGRSNAQPYVLTLLSALAVIGVFSLFARAAGLIPM